MERHGLEALNGLVLVFTIINILVSQQQTKSSAQERKAFYLGVSLVA
jgi:hypothetical protein